MIKKYNNLTTTLSKEVFSLAKLGQYDNIKREQHEN